MAAFFMVFLVYGQPMYGVHFQTDSKHCRFIKYESEYAPLRDLILKKIISIGMNVGIFIFKFPFPLPAGAEWSGASKRDRL